MSNLNVPSYYANHRQPKKMSNFLQNYALNMWLITFPWKLYQICEHWCNNSLAIIEIHLHRKNIGFNKNYTVIASPGTETSCIIRNFPLLAN